MMRGEELLLNPIYVCAHCGFEGRLANGKQDCPRCETLLAELLEELRDAEVLNELPI